MDCKSCSKNEFSGEGETKRELSLSSPEKKNGSASEEEEAGMVISTSDVSENEITDHEALKLNHYFPGDIPEKYGFQKFRAVGTSRGDKYFADESKGTTSDSDVDPDLSKNHFLKSRKVCIICKTANKVSSYLYCSHCFTFKKNLNSDRPKNPKKYLKEISSQLEVSTANKSSQSRISKNCRVCFLEPETGLFIHVKSAHLYGCYKCAKKAWFGTGYCPLCRAKVKKVAKLLIS